MSLVGTRPPTVDEWDKYELHHRARLATKPGLTGMWQVSGRSNITDLAVCLAIGFLIPEQLNGKVKNKWIKIIFVMVMLEGTVIGQINVMYLLHLKNGFVRLERQVMYLQILSMVLFFL